MTREDITELFIRAAETDRRLPFGDGPKPVKAQALPYVHDEADQAGWGGERYAEERERFWESRSTRVRASDVTDWERCNELILAVDDESERRCLWHWAIGVPAVDRSSSGAATKVSMSRPEGAGKSEQSHRLR